MSDLQQRVAEWLALEDVRFDHAKAHNGAGQIIREQQAEIADLQGQLDDINCQLEAENACLTAELESARKNAERYRFMRRKLCLSGNGDGTCSMHALNLPSLIHGWPEPKSIDVFLDCAIDATIAKDSAR